MHIHGRYVNPNPLFIKRSLWAVAKWLLWDGPKRGNIPLSSLFPRRTQCQQRLEHVHEIHGASRLDENSSDTITWIGHSSFLIRLDGVSILTDPVWSTRIFGGLGPRRLVDPGIPLCQLPKIDLVCISHNHYDHLDLPTLRSLRNGQTYLVPLGIERILLRSGITSIRTMSWWDHIAFCGLRIHSVPAQHFSVRGLLDRDKTLWSGWLFQGMRHCIYFAGDTGFWSQQFKEIKACLGPINVAILPIGAYEPSWLMQPVHLSPKEAVEAFHLLEADTLIPCHWGTFRLSEEDPEEPLRELLRIAELRRMPSRALAVLRHGATLCLDHNA